MFSSWAFLPLVFAMIKMNCAQHVIITKLLSFTYQQLGGRAALQYIPRGASTIKQLNTKSIKTMSFQLNNFCHIAALNSSNFTVPHTCPYLHF